MWYDSRNLALMTRIDRGRCGGVPFFYNKRTRRFICGATTYDNLKAWALCEACEPFLPPATMNDDKEPSEVQNKLQQFVGKVRAKAEEKMKQRRGAQGAADDDEE